MQRTIYFYEVVQQFTDNKLPDTEIRAILNNLTRASSNNATAYIQTGNDEVCRAWIQPAGMVAADELGRLKWGKTRKSGLPMIEGQGNFRPIQINASQGEGINDLSHLTFFKGGVIGFEFNFYGPRVGSLAQYISEKANCEIGFRPILNPDTAAKLARMTTVTKFELKVKSNDLAALDLGNKKFEDAVANLGEFSNCTDLTISMSVDSRKQDGLLQKVKSFAQRIVDGDEAEETVKKVKLYGKDSLSTRIDEVDLLQEFLLSKQEVVLQNQHLRVVDSISAYNAIASGYSDLKQSIKRAVG